MRETMRHILILSDLHLWQVTDQDDMWMRYRHRQFAPDAQLVALIERVYAQTVSYTHLTLPTSDLV